MFLVVNRHRCFQPLIAINVSEAPDGTEVKKKKIKEQVTGIAANFFSCCGVRLRDMLMKPEVLQSFLYFSQHLFK